MVPLETNFYKKKNVDLKIIIVIFHLRVFYYHNIPQGAVDEL